MPYSRPTLDQLISQVASDLGTAALLRMSNLKVIGKVLAKGFNALFGYADYIARQTNPFTATGEFLAAWGALKGVFIKGATPATLQVTFTGQVGQTLSAGVPCARADGFAYTTVTSAEVAANGQVVVNVQAAAAGSAGNADVGVVISLGQAQAGVAAAGAVVSVVTPGQDIEGQSQFKTRVLQAYGAPAQGGSVPDYINWALAVTGVTRAWVARGINGPGTLGIFAMMDDAEAAHGGFPQGANGVATAEDRDAPATGDQLSIANALFLEQGSTATIYVLAPQSNTVSLSISGLSGASGATKSAIQAALTALQLEKGSVGGTVQISAQAQAPGEILLSDVEGAIASVSGSGGYVIEAMAASNGAASPTSNITSSFGCLPVFGPAVFL